MKRYKLLKDLPFARAGEAFEVNLSSSSSYITLYSEEDDMVCEFINDIETFSDWFKEIKEYFTINPYMSKVLKIDGHSSSELKIKNIKSLGLLFDTEEEAEKYLEYLKAKAIIKQDAKGFKPNWNNCENKYFGYWGFGDGSLNFLVSYVTKYPGMCFKTEEDIKESFKKHPDEWKTYLTYEQQ